MLYKNILYLRFERDPYDVQLKYENFWRLLTEDRTENNFATNVLMRKSAFRAKTEIKYVNMKRKKGYPR